MLEINCSVSNRQYKQNFPSHLKKSYKKQTHINKKIKKMNPLTNSLELAQSQDLMPEAHEPAHGPIDDSTHPQFHVESGQYLKSSIYGGLDGVVNILAVIIGGIASGTPPQHIVAIGISVIIGDGIGMGLGDYLSAKAQKQFILSEQNREFWEVEHKLEAEKSEIVEIYTEKNYTLEQSRRLADLFETNHQAFVNVMMLQQLGLVVDDSNPIINGIINFLSFVILGFFPLIPYIIGYYARHDNQTQYLWTMAIGGAELFILGWMKSYLIGFSIARRFFSGFQVLILAAVGVAAGYGIGKIFENM